MTWRVDGRTFARKVKDPTRTFTTNGGTFRSEVTECPSCGYAITQGNVAQDWPGLPAGVKFDPSDKELLEHLAAKTGYCDSKPHPFIDEFIPTLDGEDGICYAHPENLPGIRHDGSSMHYFHMPARAYNTGSRKRRKINSGYESGNIGEVRWHKTGKTRPIIDNGKKLGYKKIMVLYLVTGKGTKPQKANWVMHQYHLGMHEEENEGELVVSKVFYQTQPRLPVGSNREDDFLEQVELEVDDNAAHSLLHTSASAVTSLNSRGAPTTPQSLAPSRPHTGKQCRGLLESMSEEVDRLTASFNGNTLTANLLPSQAAFDNQWKVTAEFGDTGSSVDMPTKPFQSNLLSSTMVNSRLRTTSNTNAKEGLRKALADFSPILDDMPEEEEPKHDSAPLENLVLDTPPELLLDSLVNSQDTLDWLGSRRFGDSQTGLSLEGLSAADYLLDSQSST